MKELNAFAILILSVAVSCGAEQPLKQAQPGSRFMAFVLSRDDLNKPVTPFGLYVDVSVSGGITDWHIRCTVLRGRPISHEVLLSPSELQSQVVPDRYIWKVVANDGTVIRQWLANFIKNRDGTYHTIVLLPDEDLRNSRLEMLIEDIDGDGEREDISLILEMAEYDWRVTTREVWQSR